MKINYSILDFRSIVFNMLSKEQSLYLDLSQNTEVVQIDRTEYEDVYELTYQFSSLEWSEVYDTHDQLVNKFITTFLPNDGICKIPVPFEIDIKREVEQLKWRYLNYVRKFDSAPSEELILT